MKKKTLTIIAMILVAILLISFMPISFVSAANEPASLVVVASKDKVMVGDEIEFAITLKSNVKLSTVQAGLDLSEGLTYVSGETAPNLMKTLGIAGAAGEVCEYDAGSKQVLISTNLGFNVNGQVTLAKIKCKVTGEAANYTLSLKDVAVADAKINEVGCSVVGATAKLVVPVNSISLDRNDAKMTAGSTRTLVATIDPSNATDKSVTWTSSNEAVAKVNASGVVTALKEGTATITVATKDGSATASCIVTVVCAHSETTVHPAKASTCLEQGNSEYTTCNLCGKVLNGTDAKLPLADHNYGDLIAKVDLVHTKTELKDGKAAHYECSVCHKLFNEAKKEVKAEDLVLKAAHKYGAFETTEEMHKSTCTECGYVLEEAHHGGEATCKEKAFCEVCGDAYGELDPENHVNYEVKDEVEATTEKEGYTGDVYCKDCGKLLDKGEVVPKLEKPEEEKPADPTKPKTADNSNIMLWVSLVIVSIAGVVYVIKHNQKRNVNK